MFRKVMKYKEGTNKRIGEVLGRIRKPKKKVENYNSGVTKILQ
jgi:hypothetical protein